MACIAFDPTRCKFRCLLVSSQSGSHNMTRFCFKARADSKAASLDLSPPLTCKGRLGGVSSTRLCFAHNSNGPCKKYLSDFSFALQCSFWVWLLSLSGRLAVNTVACSSTILYALSAMTRVLFQGKGLKQLHRVAAKSEEDHLLPLLTRGGWEGWF